MTLPAAYLGDTRGIIKHGHQSLETWGFCWALCTPLTPRICCVTGGLSLDLSENWFTHL